MILVVTRRGVGMNVRLGPFVGAVSKGRAARYVRTQSRNGRERWIVLTPDCRDSACMQSQFSHCGIHVGQKGRMECEKYDGLHVGLIRLSPVYQLG